MVVPKIKISDGTEDPINVVFEGVELSEIKTVLLDVEGANDFLRKEHNDIREDRKKPVLQIIESLAL